MASPSRPVWHLLGGAALLLVGIAGSLPASFLVVSPGPASPDARQAALHVPSRAEAPAFRAASAPSLGSIWATGAVAVVGAALLAGASKLARVEKVGRPVVVACRAEGTTTIGKNAEGLDMITLKRGDSSAEIFLLGGVVTSYKMGGHDWLAVRPDAKMDGSKPISGGLTHCFPQFGPGGIQQHGFARNLVWTALNSSVDGRAVLELCDTEETRAMWPYTFRFTYWVELKEGSLDTTLRVENLSSAPFEFTAALHSYYSCGKIDDLVIEGPFLGHAKLDKAKDPPALTSAPTDVVKISEFTEEIYKNVLPGKCVLTDPSKGELMLDNGGGWKDVVVWSPYGDKGMGYEGFCCVESAALTPVMCPSKGSWDGTLRLVPKPK